MIPIVVFERGHPRIVSSAIKRSDAYRRYRETVDSSKQYAEVVRKLEAAIHDPDLKLSVSLDFAPEADYARRFISTTGLHRSKPLGSPERRLADRAARVLIHLLCAGASRPAGRPVGRSFGPEMTQRVVAAHDAWAGLLRPLWMAAGGDRARLSGAIALAGRGRFTFTAAHHHELSRLLTRKTTRPSTVVVQLAAWEVGLSVHQVRRLRADRSTLLTHA